MILTNVDIIVRRWLLEHGLPIHYYAEALFQSATCVRELSFDTLKIVNAANLPVDQTASVNLPPDFQDDLSLCIPSGQYLTHLPKQDNLTPIRLHDSKSGQFVSYQDQTNSTYYEFYGYPIAGTFWFWNVNDFGEPTGGYFGAPGGSNSGYKVLREQRRIQLTEDFIGSNVVLLYIGDGSSINNASQIDPYAFATIDAFISWKRSPNRENILSPEAYTFTNEKRRLRGRKDDLDVPTFKNIIRNNYHATIKS